MTAWRVRASLLPDGDLVEAGITERGQWTLRPAAGAEELPGGFIEALAARGGAWTPTLCATTGPRGSDTPARQFLGFTSLREGEPADLVAYGSDPRDDPAVLGQPAAIFLAGTRIR